MKKLLGLIIIIVTVSVALVGCTSTPSDSQDDMSANAPTINLHLPEIAIDSSADNEISVYLKENCTDNNLTSNFAIALGEAVLMSINGESADSTIEWNGERDVVLKVRLAGGAADSGKFKMIVTSSWVEFNGVSDDSLTHSVTKDIFYATKNGKIAYSLKSETDAWEKLN